MALALLFAAPSAAEEPAAWECEVSGAVYVLPDEEDFVQPTVRADRGGSTWRPATTTRTVSFRKLAGTLYAFNPGSDDHFTVVSLGLAFPFTGWSRSRGR